MGKNYKTVETNFKIHWIDRVGFLGHTVFYCYSFFI
jgi:hypothetical protein